MIYHHLNSGYVWHYYLLRPWEFVRDLCHEVKAFWQRGTRGYADSDVWGFCEYMSAVFVGGIDRLIKNDISLPPEYTEKQWTKRLKEIRAHFDWYANHQEDETFAMYDRYPEWINLSLQEIIDGKGREIIPDWEWKNLKKITKKNYDKFDKVWDLLKEDFGHLND
jgi:hypothetical protein